MSDTSTAAPAAPETPAASGGSATKLQGLAGLTQEVDQANPTPEQQQAAAVEVAKASEAEQGAREWGMLMYSVGGLAQMIAPELQAVYTEERCFKWGQQAQAVAEKYGWKGTKRMPELALIAGTAGFAVPTVLIIRARMQQAKAAKDGSIAEKIALWWHTRKARREADRQAAKTAEQTQGAVAPEGQGDGRQQ